MQLQSCPREWERGTSGGEDGWDRMRCHAPSDFFSLCPSSATCKSQTLLPKRELRGKGEEKEKKKLNYQISINTWPTQEGIVHATQWYRQMYL
jgi:hypothetical protein